MIQLCNLLFSPLRQSLLLSFVNYFSEIEVSTEGVVYASLSSDGADKGIWRSENGIEWNNILPEDWPSTYDRIKMAINPNNENEVYFLAVTPDFGQENLDFYHI